MVTCYIALGSNLGPRHKNIKLALEYLNQDPAIEILKVSSLTETKPYNCPAQPNFINGVAKLQTTYSARKLLSRLQQIEVKLGRKLPRLKNQPRTIDLDILIFGELNIDQKDLKIPHPQMQQRGFILKPLREIAPEIF